MAGWCFSYTCLKRLMTFWAVVKVASTHTVHFTGTNPQSMRLHLPTAQDQDKIIVKIYYQSSMRLQVFVGSTFVEDVNSLDGKGKAQLVRDGRLSPNNDQGGYSDQHIHLTDACSIGGSSADTIKCMTPSNVHGANRFNRAESMLEVVVAAHDSSSFIEIQSMPVVAVSMGVSTSVADFYKVKDSFLSNLAFVLGIDVKRITIVDVVAGNARRRRRNLLEASTIVNFEVEPAPVIQLDTSAVTVLENVVTVAIQVKRSVNIFGECGFSYSVTNMSSDTAVPGVNFVAKSGSVRFESKEVTQEITIEILSEPGYRAEDLQFTLTISDAENATLGATQMTVIAVRNVHMPAPAAPTMVPSRTSKTAIMVAWSPVSWHAAPSEALNTTLGWDLECRHPDSEVALRDFNDVAVPFVSATQSLVGGLSTYRRVQCRIRVQAGGGWSDWSAVSSDMYTLSECGDCNRHGTEQCDDGGITGGDGCSSTCSVEAGYACSVVGGVDVCNNGCGNGTVEAGEFCDDGNAVVNDGCDGSCRIEQGWQCEIIPNGSWCYTAPGDGFRVSGKEQCDDGNQDPADGCSAHMEIESGFSCSEDSSGKSTCKNCGNGKLEGDETCDDAGASSACLNCTRVKPGWRCAGTSCSAGPARVSQPVLSSAQETSLQVRWTAPNSNGLAISSYVVQWLNTSSNSWDRAASATVPSSVLTYTMSNLTSSTSYRSRIRACNAEGCNADYSTPSTALSTLKRVVALEEIGEKVGSAAATAASSSGVQVQNGSIGVLKPPPEPAAPPPSAELNETAVAAAQQQEASRAEQALLALVPRGSDFAIGFSGAVKDRTVLESHGKLVFPLQLVRKSDGSTSHEGCSDLVSVEWEIQGAVAAPTDVSKTSGFVAFSPGQVNKTLEIHIVDNAAINYNRAPKWFELKLVRPLGGSSVLADRSKVTVTMTDNDEPASVALTRQVSVQAGAVAQIPFSRTAWMASALKLKYRLQEDTAKANEDYSAAALNAALEATLGAGAATGTISIQTLNAQRGKQIQFNVVLEEVQSECAAGDGQFLCGAVMTTNKAVVTIEPLTCGDGVRGAGETCDDGNAVSEDGCSDKCSVEAGFVCDPSLDQATAKTGGHDVCKPPGNPPKDSVFLKATAKMEGITEAEFVGDKRKIFKQSIADSVKVDVANVVITKVTTVSSRRAGTLLEVEFQMQVPEADKDKVAQAVVNAAADGSLSKSLKAGGLNVEVSAVSPPTFVKSDGSSGEVNVVVPVSNGAGNMLMVVLLVVVGLLCVSIIVCCVFRKKLETCVAKGVAPEKSVDQEATPDQEAAQKETQVVPNETSARAAPTLQDAAPELVSNDDINGHISSSRAPGEAGAERPQTSHASDAVTDEEFLAETRQAMKPLWGHIVDDFVALGETEGRFLTEEQIVQVVHEAHARAITAADSVKDMKQFVKIHRRDFPRLLQMHGSVVGSMEGTDYLSFCEMMAPDLLSRRAFQLFCQLSETKSRGVCVAELQHAMMLGRIAPDDIAAISGCPQLEYPSTVEEPVRQRIPFSQIFASLERVAVAGNAKRQSKSGPPLAPNPLTDLDQTSPPPASRRTSRGKLERDLQASCDAMAAAASYHATCDAARSATPRRPTTGRLGSNKLLAPLSHTSHVAGPADVADHEKLYMSKFEGAENTANVYPDPALTTNTDKAGSAGDPMQSEVRGPSVCLSCAKCVFVVRVSTVCASRSETLSV